MHKGIKAVLMIILLFVFVGCANNQTTREEEITPEIYYAVIPDSQGYIVNQVGELIVSRTLFKDSKGNYEPYYIEMISEVIANENREQFLQNENTAQVVANIYNSFAKEMNLSSRIEPEQFSEVKFTVIQEGENLNLTSTSKVEIEDNSLSVYEVAIESTGLNWINTKHQ